jgi:hypothetical protein
MARANRGIIFLILLIVILGIYVYYTTAVKEGFKDKVEPVGAVVNLDAEMPSASFTSTAKTAPKMWVDGSREPTTRDRVASLVENMKAFLAFEAVGLDDISDPAVQVPLVTLKGDLKTLESEVLFLKKNPGIAPNITMTQMQEMEANLDGLRRRARKLSGSVDQVEGFTSGSDMDTEKADCPNASLAQIKDLDGRIDQEVTRLSANGTNDSVINARINNLQTIKASVRDVINQVESNVIAESEIPIYTCDIANFLTVLGDSGQTKGIPALFQKMGLTNLFPPGTDPETIKQSNDLLSKYGEKLMNGLSAGVSFTAAFRYVSPNEVSLSQTPVNININNGSAVAGSGLGAGVPGAMGETSSVSTVSAYGFPSDSDLHNVSYGASVAGSGPVQGQGSAPGSFDWKMRTRQICAAVKKRGLDPADFGCLKSDEVSDSFDWRSHTKMVCSRLGTSYETGLPELVGCPDFNWAGWSSRQM